MGNQDKYLWDQQSETRRTSQQQDRQAQTEKTFLYSFSKMQLCISCSMLAQCSSAMPNHVFDMPMVFSEGPPWARVSSPKSDLKTDCNCLVVNIYIYWFVHMACSKTKLPIPKGSKKTSPVLIFLDLILLNIFEANLPDPTRYIEYH